MVAVYWRHAEKQPGYRYIEQRPYHIHDRGGEALARWLGEGRWKFVARNAVHKMGDHICSDTAGEENSQIFIPFHSIDVLNSKGGKGNSAGPVTNVTIWFVTSA